MLKKICSVVLCVVLTLMCAHISGSVTLAANQTALVTGSDVAIRADATTTSTCRTRVSWVEVTVTGTKKGTDNSYTWYAVTYNSFSGYIREDYIKLIEPVEPDPDFETQLKAFPESYRPYLERLHAIYPNWVFRADKLTMSFEEAVYNEDVWPRKLVNLDSDKVSWRSMGAGSYNWTTNTWNNTEGGWTGASREVIAYHMDPRNFLNETYIYMFMMATYSPEIQTADGLKSKVSGTFLAKGYSDPKDTAYGGSYVNVIMEAAKQSNISPYVLASTILQEQGSGTNALVSGEKGYYNFLNIGSTGETDEEIIDSGIKYAKSQGWDTRSKAIIDGAIKYAQNYVNSGQDTYFNKDFDLINSPYYTFQYAQNIYDAHSLGKRDSSSYAKLFNAKLTFRIPVYTSIPDKVTERPVEDGRRNNYYILSSNIPSFSMYDFDYSFSVSGDTTINVTLPSGASLVSPRTNTLKQGTNVIGITVKAETGYTRTYTLYVTASAPCVLTVPQGTETGDGGGTMLSGKKGDTNGDNLVDVIDLAAVRLHMLNIKKLSGDAYRGADTNGDNVIDVIDLAAVRLHMLKIKPLE